MGTLAYAETPLFGTTGDAETGLLLKNPNDGTTLLGTARDVGTRAHAGT